MKIAAMFDDIRQALLQRPITRRYPFERTPPSEHLRGRLNWNPAQCTGCALCTKDCPADAIKLITVDKAKKRFVIEYSVDRCTFCGQCVESCRFNCLTLASDQWELAALDTHSFTSYLGDPADVDVVLARSAAPKPELQPAEQP